MRYYATRRDSAWAVDPTGTYVLRREQGLQGAIHLAPTPDPRAWPCLCAYDTPFSDPDYYDLGDNLGQLPDSVANALSNRFSISFPDKRLDRILAQLLMQEGRLDGSRWRNLRPSKRRGRYEIWLGGLAWTIPYIAGGTSISESFNKADADTLGPDLTWTETAGDWDVVTNQAKVNSENIWCDARAESALASDDHYAQVDVVAIPMPPTNTRSHYAGPAARFAAAARTFYHGYIRSYNDLGVNTTWVRIDSVSAGTHTALGSLVVVTLSLPDTLKLSCDGSTITLDLNGVNKVTLTNTTIVDNLYCGLAAFIDGSGAPGDIDMDIFSAADLAAQTFLRYAPAAGQRTLLSTATQMKYDHNSGQRTMLSTAPKSLEYDTSNAGVKAS